MYGGEVPAVILFSGRQSLMLVAKVRASASEDYSNNGTAATALVTFHPRFAIRMMMFVEDALFSVDIPII